MLVLKNLPSRLEHHTQEQHHEEGRQEAREREASSRWLSALQEASQKALVCRLISLSSLS